MKKLLYTLLALATALTAASCTKELEGNKVADGAVANITISATIGPKTKAFADGTTVDKLYVGLYEIGDGPTYTWIADNSDAPVAITSTVTFTGKIALGKSYKVVLWAQKTGAPYNIEWAKSATTGPTVTVTATGEANDEARDAFFGLYDTGTVSGSIDLSSSPVNLKRPFAQVNVLVPTANFVNPSAAITSSMTIDQAPTVLNLITKATSVPTTWSFTTAGITENAFGTYAANSYKYVAMNYVLVDQAGASTYDATFSVSSASTPEQSITDRAVNALPLKPNIRTNIAGNIFDNNFTLIIGGNVTPGFEKVATPTFTPAAGDYDAVQNVTIDCSTVGATIHYTTDGSAPTASSATYSSAIEVSATTTIKAIAVKDGMSDSDVASATYTITLPPVATPTFSPAAGTYDVAQNVTIDCSTVGATIHYTTDGSTPTGSSATYSSAIPVSVNTTIKAIAVKAGMSDSEVATAAYAIKVATPTFSVAAGAYNSAQSVELACTTDGATIYYTTDGTTPTNTSSVYSSAIAVGSTMTIKAIAMKNDMTSSNVATASYTIKKTYTLTITSNDLDQLNPGESSSYAKYAGDQTFTAVASDSSEISVVVNISDVMPGTGQNSGKLQIKASSGTLYNKTDLGAISSISVADGLSLSQTIGSTESPTDEVANGGFFKLVKTTSNAGYTTSITVVFTK